MLSRRRFLQGSLTAGTVALLPWVPRVATAATLKVRQNWNAFSQGPMFPIYLEAIGKMRANTHAADPNSWTYWVNVHKYFCPHSTAYFLAWHRGFLFRLEAQLRKVAGNSSLVLPYWDYYTQPVMPAEFTDTASPLYIENRKSTDVTAALSLNAFADTVVNFQRGLVDAFEPAFETLPHNPVHNIIGGAMGSVTVSPRDPIFWLHHANVDRLWAAWVSAGNGRSMPPKTDAYWKGSFNYGSGVPTMARTWAYSTTGLGYQYEDETMPTSLPALPSLAPMSAVTMQASSSTLPQALVMTLGNGQPLSLDERSVTVTVPLDDAGRSRVRSLLLRRSPKGAAPVVNDAVRLVLDGVRLTRLGLESGFFYKLYINLPTTQGLSQTESRYLLGTLGAFEITGILNHESLHGGKMHGLSDPVQLSFPMTDALKEIWPATLDALTISFVRMDGAKPRKGTVITIKELRVDASDASAMPM
ncbi:MAG TPA: tyrosinase family protein [Dyella sp.]|nr:tyrosinase family protein [Dyella sp.]